MRVNLDGTGPARDPGWIQNAPLGHTANTLALDARVGLRDVQTSAGVVGVNQSNLTKPFMITYP